MVEQLGLADTLLVASRQSITRGRSITALLTGIGLPVSIASSFS